MFKDVTQEYNRMITLSYRGGGGETEYASLQIFNFLGKKKMMPMAEVTFLFNTICSSSTLITI